MRPIRAIYLLLGGAGAEEDPTDPDPESCLEAIGRLGALKLKLPMNLNEYFPRL